MTQGRPPFESRVYIDLKNGVLRLPPLFLFMRHRRALLLGILCQRATGGQSNGKTSHGTAVLHHSCSRYQSRRSSDSYNLESAHLTSTTSACDISKPDGRCKTSDYSRYHIFFPALKTTGFTVRTFQSSMHSSSILCYPLTIAENACFKPRQPQ